MLTQYEIFTYEWAKSCFELNSNQQNEKRFKEIEKVILRETKAED